MEATKSSLVFHSKRFEFSHPSDAPGRGIKSFCQVDVFIPANWKQRVPSALVIMSDPAKDSGVSVTNASETIANKIMTDILIGNCGPDLTPGVVLWIERYGRVPGREFEMFDQVSYSVENNVITNPSWRGIHKDAFEKSFGITFIDGVLRVNS